MIMLFSQFAFTKLLVHIVKQDVKKFLRENFQKYFIKNEKIFEIFLISSIL